MSIKLTIKDKIILQELEMNAKIQHSALAKKARLSKQVIKYRIQKLENLNIIQGYNAIVDISKLNETISILYIKLIKLSSKDEKEWIEKIRKQPNILSVGKNSGEWDLTVVFKSKNNIELNNTLNNITSNKSKNIKKKLLTTEIKSSYLSMNLFGKSPNKEFSTSEITKLKIDKEDKQILSILSINCRTTLLEISKKISMSPNGVKNKIKNLEKQNIIIGYKTKINYESLDYIHFRVFLHLNNQSEKLYNQIKEFLKNKGNVESVSKYIGYADLDFRCYCSNILELYDLISEIRDKFLDTVIEVNSMPIFNWDSINYYSNKGK